LAGANSFIKHDPNGTINAFLASGQPATVVEYKPTTGNNSIELRQANQITNSSPAFLITGASSTGGTNPAGAVALIGGSSDGYVDAGGVDIIGGVGGSTSGNGGILAFYGGPSLAPKGGIQSVITVEGGYANGTGGSAGGGTGNAGAGSGANGGNFEIGCGHGDGYGSGGTVYFAAGPTTTTPTALGGIIEISGATATGNIYPETGVPVGSTIILSAGSNSNGSFGAAANFFGAGNVGGGPVTIVAGDGTNNGGLIN